MKFNKYSALKDSDLIPKFWPGILNYTLYNWDDICLMRTYECLPSKRYLKSNPYFRKKIQDNLVF